MKYIIISLLLTSTLSWARTGDVYYMYDVANQLLQTDDAREPANDNHDSASEFEHDQSLEDQFSSDEGKQDE